MGSDRVRTFVGSTEHHLVDDNLLRPEDDAVLANNTQRCAATSRLTKNCHSENPIAILTFAFRLLFRRTRLGKDDLRVSVRSISNRTTRFGS